MQASRLLLAAVLLALPLAGCLGDSTASVPSPYGKVRETGRTIHLKASVVDLYGTQIYPDPERDVSGSPQGANPGPGTGGDGFVANLWGFCFEPFDPKDTVSAAAIEYWDPLPTDWPQRQGEDRKVCSAPGPTIRVKQGDRVLVEFSHNHFHPHTIHWHGQFVPWQMDGAPGVSSAGIEAGETFVYDFVAKKAGTLWYHCHVDTQLHVMQGLFGAFIVEPADKEEEPKDIDRDYVWLLGTMNRDQVEAVPGLGAHNHPPGCNKSGEEGCQNPTIAGPIDTWTLNGHSYPLTMQHNGTLLKMAEGERIRLRIINAGDTMETIHPHGHDMLVTHRDGTPLASPFWVDVLTVGPAERYDVVIEANNPGVWMAHTHINSHETNDGVAPGGMHTMMVYEGYEHEMHRFDDVLPGGESFATAPTIPGDVQRTFVMDLGTNQTAFEVAAFSVEQPCSVRQVTVRARLTSGAAPVDAALGGLPQAVRDELPDADALNRIFADVRDPAGTYVPRSPGNESAGTVQTVRLPSSGPWVTLWEIDGKELAGWGDGSTKNIPAGLYTVEVRGRAVDALVVVEVVVDYYGSFEQAKLGAEFGKYSVCPGFGQ